MSSIASTVENAISQDSATAHTRFQVYTEKQLNKIQTMQGLSDEQIFNMRVVANVLPFRVNQYVIDELIDWNNIPQDPIYQLTFPQQGMLTNKDFDRMADALRSEDKKLIQHTASEIRAALNPHPAGQQLLNVPQMGEE